MDLIELGWSDSLAAGLEALQDEKLKPARVAREERGLYLLYMEDGELSGEVSGSFRHETTARADYPAVGDWVAVSPRPGGGAATIHAVLPRKGCFSRKAAGRTSEEQVLVANVDTVFLTMGLDHDFNVRRMERYLTLAWDSGASPVVALNKADVCDDVEGRVAEVAAIAPAVPVHALSALEREGLDVFRQYLSPGRTVAFLGSSGVGKSTIINALLGEERQDTGPARVDDGRGRHTTTRRELILAPGGGLIVDTPGLREIQLWAGEDDLSETFQEIEQLAPTCRFSDCTHVHEPGCAVLAALADGSLDRARYRSYRKLRKELAYLERKQDAAARRAEEMRWKQITISARKRSKLRGKP